jgi:hypothetical protein
MNLRFWRFAADDKKVGFLPLGGLLKSRALSVAPDSEHSWGKLAETRNAFSLARMGPSLRAFAVMAGVFRSNMPQNEHRPEDDIKFFTSLPIRAKRQPHEETFRISHQGSFHVRARLKA